MDYSSSFAQQFVDRTLALIRHYDAYVMTEVEPEQQYETTLLINCLLGLLLLPSEHYYNRILPLPVEQLSDWGIEDGMIKKWGHVRKGTHNRVPAEGSSEVPHTLKELAHGLRNGAAHINILPTSVEGQVAVLRFWDRNGFEAELPVAKLKQFVTKLAESIRTLH